MCPVIQTLTPTHPRAQDVYNKLEVLHGNYTLGMSPQQETIDEPPGMFWSQNFLFSGTSFNMKNLTLGQRSHNFPTCLGEYTAQHWLGQAELPDRIVCTGSNELHYAPNKVRHHFLIKAN